MTLKGNRHQPVCSRYSEFVRQLTGSAMCLSHLHMTPPLMKDLWLQLKGQTPCMFFSSTFSFVYSRGLVVTITSTPWALFRGDEGVGRRYEANISYGLLGSQHKHSHHRAC